ncbi:MAG: metallophosphoesterase family protein [Chloroflexota bacterium]
MRVIIMSDIHGNLRALRAVVAALPGADRVIVAGDHVLDGPEPAAVMDLLEELGWDLLLGNTDRDIVTPPDGLSVDAGNLINWTRDQLGEKRLATLASLPFSHAIEDGGSKLALVVHANPLDLDRPLPPDMSAKKLRPFLAAVDADLLAFGHLHIPYTRPVAGKLLVDVSSVGHPKDLDVRAAYTVVEWNSSGGRSVTQARVPYDLDAAIADIRGRDMPAADLLARSLRKASY